ncbi:hypothetical protein BGZ63DRAFT_388546 [Mariannaea sp. PMI_226]|nr:hypothetical protein BGZ63DRAFT_388546 [Mariannaea sp. PMI_226]
MQLRPFRDVGNQKRSKTTPSLTIPQKNHLPNEQSSTTTTNRLHSQPCKTQDPLTSTSSPTPRPTSDAYPKKWRQNWGSPDRCICPECSTVPMGRGLSRGVVPCFGGQRLFFFFPCSEQISPPRSSFHSAGWRQKWRQNWGALKPLYCFNGDYCM